MENIHRRYNQIDEIVSNDEAIEDQDVIKQERLHLFKVVHRERRLKTFFQSVCTSRIFEEDMICLQREFIEEEVLKMMKVYDGIKHQDMTILSWLFITNVGTLLRH